MYAVRWWPYAFVKRRFIGMEIVLLSILNAFKRFERLSKSVASIKRVHSANSNGEIHKNHWCFCFLKLNDDCKTIGNRQTGLEPRTLRLNGSCVSHTSACKTSEFQCLTLASVLCVKIQKSRSRFQNSSFIFLPYILNLEIAMIDTQTNTHTKRKLYISHSIQFWNKQQKKKKQIRKHFAKQTNEFS